MVSSKQVDGLPDRMIISQGSISCIKTDSRRLDLDGAGSLGWQTLNGYFCLQVVDGNSDGWLSVNHCVFPEQDRFGRSGRGDGRHTRGNRKSEGSPDPRAEWSLARAGQSAADLPAHRLHRQLESVWHGRCRRDNGIVSIMAWLPANLPPKREGYMMIVVLETIMINDPETRSYSHPALAGVTERLNSGAPARAAFAKTEVKCQG